MSSNLKQSAFLKENLEQAQNRIKIALARCDQATQTIIHGQTSSATRQVKLLAVSKNQPIEAIMALLEQGIVDFGENYAQELKKKALALGNFANLRWHFIGHLQRNKLKDVLPYCYAIHSLNRLELLEAIEEKMNAGIRPHTDGQEKLRVFVQLQIDEQDITKNGANFDQAKKICAQLAQSKNLTWAGFMGMGPAKAPSNRLLDLYQEFYARCMQLWQMFFKEHMTQKPEISLGMTNDLEEAIKSGSTLVRLGTAIFGEREKSI